MSGGSRPAAHHNTRWRASKSPDRARRSAARFGVGSSGAIATPVLVGMAGPRAETRMAGQVRWIIGAPRWANRMWTDLANLSGPMK
jgi:hypothetical protein